MCLGYGKMGKVLWGSEQIGEVTDRQMVSLKSKRRVSTKKTTFYTAKFIGFLSIHLEIFY